MSTKAIQIKGSNLALKDIEMLNKLGLSLRKQGKWGEARDCYIQALKLAPNDEGLYYNLALAYADGDLTGKACDAIRKGLKINPNFWKNNPVVAYNIGNIFLTSGQEADAEKYLEFAKKNDPSLMAVSQPSSFVS